VKGRQVIKNNHKEVLNLYLIYDIMRLSQGFFTIHLNALWDQLVKRP